MDSNFESVNSYIKYLKDNPKISIDCKTFHNFFNLASNTQKHTLVQEIISIAKRTKNQPNAQANIADTFKNIEQNIDTILALVDEGVIPVLISLANQSNTLLEQRNIAYVIKKIADTRSGLQDLKNVDILPSLIKLVKVPDTANDIPKQEKQIKEFKNTKLALITKIREDVAFTLCVLSQSSTFRQSLIDTDRQSLIDKNIVPALILMANQDNTLNGEIYTLSAISYIAIQSKAIRRDLINANIIQILIKNVSKNDSEEFQDLIRETVDCILFDDDDIETFVQKNTIPTLFSISNQFRPPSTQFFIGFIIEKIDKSNFGKQALDVWHAMNPLFLMIRKCNTLEERKSIEFLINQLIPSNGISEFVSLAQKDNTSYERQIISAIEIILKTDDEIIDFDMNVIYSLVSKAIQQYCLSRKKYYKCND